MTFRSKNPKITFIDPGKNMGWALFHGPKYIDSGHFKLKDIKDAWKILTITDKWLLDGIVIEGPPYGTRGKGPQGKTLAHLHFLTGYLCGIADITGAYWTLVSNITVQHLLKTYGYAGYEGKTRAEKKKLAVEAAREIFSLDKKITHDEADAILLGAALWADGKIYDVLPEAFL